MVRAHPVTFSKDEFLVLFLFIRNFRAKICKMHYNKSMKKTVFIFCVCFVPAWAGAQSTCETRVDAHPHATTLQRVNYCLNAAQEESSNNPGLVFSGVTVRHPADEQAASHPSAHNGYFKQDKIEVSQTFVETQQFPKLTNDTLSEREIWQRRRAAYQAPVQQAEVAGQEAVRLPQEKFMSQEVVPSLQGKQFAEVPETKAGLKARKTKPGRRLVQEPVVNEEAASAAPETATQEVAPVADEYAYDSVTPQPYVPATQDAQEYVPAQQSAQPYEPYAPAGQEEIPAGTASYAPAN